MYLISAPPCPARFPLRGVLTPCPPPLVLTPCPPPLVLTPCPPLRIRGEGELRTTHPRSLRSRETAPTPTQRHREAGRPAGRASGPARTRRTAGTAGAAR